MVAPAMLWAGLAIAATALLLLGLIWWAGGVRSRWSDADAQAQLDAARRKWDDR